MSIFHVKIACTTALRQKRIWLVLYTEATMEQRGVEVREGAGPRSGQLLLSARTTGCSVLGSPLYLSGTLHHLSLGRGQVTLSSNL